jgi:hypothetical protein
MDVACLAPNFENGGFCPFAEISTELDTYITTMTAGLKK